MGATRAVVSEKECQTVPEETAVLRPMMPELDAVRGIAVLAVLFYHGLFWSYGTDGASGFTRILLLATKPGWLGVELFFVLSGFLITGILLDSKDRSNYFRRFYLRRVLRILPAYFAVLLGLLCFGMINVGFFVCGILFLANITALLGIPLQYPPLWSLAVEEHFYLVWPAVVYLLSARWLSVITVALVVICPVLRLMAFYQGLTDGLYTYTWFTCDGLAMGALLALFVRHWKASRRAVLIASILAIGCAALMLAVGIPFGILHRTTPLGACLQYSPWCLLFTGLLATVLLVGTTPFRYLVQLSPLRFFGNISFGLYLIHMAFFVFYDSVLTRSFPNAKASEMQLDRLLLRLAVAGGASILLAALSRRYFEEPFMRLKDRLAP